MLFILFGCMAVLANFVEDVGYIKISTKGKIVMMTLKNLQRIDRVL